MSKWDIHGKLFRERLNILYGKYNENKSKMERESDYKISRDDINNWINKNVCPSAEKLICIANTFGVSVDYLLGISESQYYTDDVVENIKDFLYNIFSNDFIEQVIKVRFDDKFGILNLSEKDILNKKFGKTSCFRVCVKSKVESRPKPHILY